MTYLLSFFGGCEAYGPAAKKLGAAFGFAVNSTAVQNNTDKTRQNITGTSSAPCSPLSVVVLDYYHALEHLGAFCDLYNAPQAGKDP